MTEKLYHEIVNQIYTMRREKIYMSGITPKRVFISIRLFQDLVQFNRDHVHIDPVDHSKITVFGIKLCRSQDLEYNETHVV